MPLIAATQEPTMTMQFRVIATKADRQNIDLVFTGATNERGLAQAERVRGIAVSKGYAAHIRIEQAQS
jgi:hypothetical protein